LQSHTSPKNKEKHTYFQLLVRQNFFILPTTKANKSVTRPHLSLTGSTYESVLPPSSAQPEKVIRPLGAILFGAGYINPNFL